MSYEDYMNVPDRLRQPPELLSLQIAREIAMDLLDVEDILKRYGITAKEWDRLQRNQYFQRVLQQAVIDWGSALNTEQRVKVKSAALFEEWLVEANRLAHDPQQPLSSKVELMKMLRAAGFAQAGGGEGSGERFSVTINLGADNQLKIEKTVTPKVIEGEVT